MSLLSMNKRVAIIGAGPAGLITAHQLKASGHQPIIFEASDRCGGLFARYSSEKPFWNDLQLSSSKRITEFSAFPAPDEFYDFMELREVAEYYQRFAEEKDLDIRFRCPVKKVRINAEDSVEVTFEDGVVKNFDHAIICSGANHKKLKCSPVFSGYEGEILHSDEIDDLEHFAGKDVLIKGVGESTMYVAGKIASVAKRVVITSRHGCNLVPRTLTEIPLDMFYFWKMRPLVGKLYHSFGSTGGTSVGENRTLSKLLKNHYITNGHKIDQFKSRSSFSTEYSIKFFWGRSENGKYEDNLQILNRLHNIGFAKEVIKCNGEDITFDDGTTEHIDIVISGSGFMPVPNVDLPITVSPTFYRKLYKGIVHPSLGDKVMFNGFTRPNVGSFPQMAEMSSYLIENIVSGKRKLRLKNVFEVIETDNIDHAMHSPLLADRPFIREYRSWMQKMASLVGRKPRLSKMGLNPTQLLCFFGGPHIVHRYDLDSRGRFSDEYAKITRMMFRNSSYRQVFLNFFFVAISFWVLTPLSLVMAYLVSPWWLLAPLGGLVLGRLNSIPFYRKLLKNDIRKMKQFGQQYRSWEWPKSMATASRTEPNSASSAIPESPV